MANATLNNDVGAADDQDNGVYLDIHQFIASGQRSTAEAVSFEVHIKLGQLRNPNSHKCSDVQAIRPANASWFEAQSDAGRDTNRGTGAGALRDKAERRKRCGDSCNSRGMRNFRLTGSSRSIFSIRVRTSRTAYRRNFGRHPSCFPTSIG